MLLANSLWGRIQPWNLAHKERDRTVHIGALLIRQQHHHTTSEDGVHMLVTILTDATAAFGGVTYLSQAWDTLPSGR